MIASDTREVWRRYDVKEPAFGTAPDALLQGFAEIQECELHMIACVQQPVHTPPLIHGSIHNHSLVVPKMGWLRTGYMGCVRATRRELRRIKPDLVHGQGTERNCAWTAVWSGYPNVLTIHGNIRAIARLYRGRPFSFEWITARLEGLTLPRTDGVVCITRYTKGEVGDAARRTWLIPNAVDSAFFAVKSEPAPERVLLSVGLICPHKNQNLFIRAMDELASKASFKIRFFGNVNEQEPYGREFAELVRSRPWCEYRGFASREELRTQMAQATLLVLPSVEDNCPMVVLEAMAAGVPVAAANVGGVPDLISHGENGVLFNPNDMADIRSKVDKLLQNPVRTLEIAARARQLAWERFRPAVIARQHVAVYREMMDRHQRR